MSVTVIIPAYRVARFIGAALDSVLCQPETSRVIVVDDACPESSGAAAVLHTTDPRVSVISLETNSGQYAAINTALSLVDTPYAAVLDGDDVAVPDRLERSLTPLKAKNARIVSGRMGLIGVNGEAVAGKQVGADLPMDPTGVLGQRYGQAMVLPACVFETAAARELGGFDATWGGSDTQFFCRAWYAGVTMLMLPDVLTLWRQHDGQVTRRIASDLGRRAYQQKAQAEWAYWRQLKRDGRLRPHHLRIAMATVPWRPVERQAE